jgi:uncharacterized SAM-binding protein YcdF (DUF218 family)
MAGVAHLLGALLMPLPIASFLAIVGLVARRLGRPRAARVTLLAALALGLGATLGPVANALLKPLETRYRAVVDASRLGSQPRYIAVLGSGYAPRDGLPVTAALDQIGVVRLAEGLRLYRQLPGSVLILSGGPVGPYPPSARGYLLAATALGVPSSSVVVVDAPRNTTAEIRMLHDRIGDAAVLLVTSAAHMPRVMALCARSGLHAVPAPTGQLAGSGSLLNGGTWLPSGTHLRMTEIALHEYLGLLALWLGLA